MPETDLGLLIDAARAASKIAGRHFGAAPGTWDKPGGHGPVTEADLEVDRMLRAELLRARPGYGWLSEESTDGPERLDSERVFIVDPIDGTRAFIAGEHAWAHALAVVESGRVVTGVVYLPKLGRLYHAARGSGAWCNDERLTVSARATLTDARVLANANQMSPGFWPGGVPRVERYFCPSLAYRICLVAEGRYDAMLTFRDAWEWDVAAGALIASEAGAAVSDGHGAETRFNNPVPKLPGFIAAGPALHAEILQGR